MKTLFNSLSELESIVESDLHLFPDKLHICLKIIRYISSRQFDEVQHLTFQSFINLTESPLDANLAESIQYLSGERATTLVPKYEFIDDNDTPYPLDLEQVNHLKKHKLLEHPGTGEYVDNAMDKVFIYFSPSDQLRNIQEQQ